MKKAIYITTSLLVLSSVAFVALYLFAGKKTPQPGTAVSSEPFGNLDGSVTDTNPQRINPNAGGATATTTKVTHTITVTATDGSAITVSNFSEDPETVQDPVNKGAYFLGYHSFDVPNSPGNLQSPYYIQYDDPSQSFSISLNQEPLFQSRLQAEQYLMQKLNISQTDMCKVRYMLTVPAFVSPVYYGKDLKFSFCPGAMKLPQ